MSLSELTLAPAVLFIATLIALRVALTAGRSTTAGRASFVWLMTAVAEWCLTGAFGDLTPTLAGKLVWAKASYLGIVSVGPLWLTFAAEYAGAAWINRGRTALSLWIIPILTLVVVFAYSPLLWPSVSPAPDGKAIFSHGPWFFVVAIYTYVLLFAGSFHLLRAMRRSPGYRSQFVALVVASLIPWLANLAYITRAVPLGSLDPTPLAFTVSGLLVAWAIYRRNLFNVIPMARDQLVEGLSDAVIVLDDARRVVDLNAAARGLMPTAQACVGRPIGELFPFLVGVADSSTVSSVPLVTDLTVRDVVYEIHVTPVLSDRSRRSASVMLLRDVTDRRRASEEREQLVRRKSDFVATVSHELRTPLFSIHGALQLLAGGPSKLEPPDRRLLQIALASSERLAKITNDILDVSRMDAQQRRPPRREPLAVDRLVADALFDASHAARTAGVTIEARVPPSLPLMFGDHDQLVQVLVNLLSNAVKFSPADAVVLVSADADAAFVSVSVQDQGRGVAAADVNRLFEMYTRVSGDKALSPQGTGLGLAIAKDIVEQHGGRIEVTSPAGGGALFTVFVPRAPISLSVTAAAEPDVVTATKVGHAHLLVVDDDDDVRAVVVEALERARFHVRQALSGQEALAILERDDIDLLILDLNMPGTNGHDVLRVLRSKPSGARLPVIVLSGHIDSARLPSDIGADAVIIKPANLRRLVREVNVLLARA